MAVQKDYLDGQEILRWRKRNSYYYKWLERIYRFVVRPNSRVLHIGCECGDLLNAVQPCYGVGIDSNPKAIELAKERFGNLNFQTMDPHEFETDEKFDYVLICNSLGRWHDIQQVLQKIQSACTEDTRIVITYYSHLWEWILNFGSLVRLRRPYAYQNWLPPSDIINLLNLSNYETVRTDSHLTMPKWIPVIAEICNYGLSLLPGLRHLNLVNLVVARPRPRPKKDEDLSVSVVVPCRNEKGNIANAVKRIPQMGKETEIIFVDGNSIDGTIEEIEK